VSILYPGSTSDCLAFEGMSLYEQLENGLLHKSLCLFGDNAYLNATYMATQYTSAIGVNVEANKGLVTNVGQLTTKGYVARGRVDDKSEVATSWVNVVRKKRPSGPSRLVGNQSVAMLTLFTKPKVVN